LTSREKVKMEMYTDTQIAQISQITRFAQASLTAKSIKPANA